MLKTLPHLVTHLIDTGGKSLISRNYGAFRIKCKNMDSIYLMLQRNNLRPLPTNEMISTFDLKGSKFQRKAVKDQAFKRLLQKAYEYDEGSESRSSNPLMKLKTELNESRYDTKKKLEECKRKFLKSLQIYTLKDNDFESLSFTNKLKINMHQKDMRAVVQTMKRDSEWLKSMGMMDYSILLGIEEVNKNHDNSRDVTLYIKAQDTQDMNKNHVETE